MSQAPDDPRVPPVSLVFGFGPMLPLVVAGAGPWLVPRLGPLAVQCAIVWAAVILCFVGGVRRGFAFGYSPARTGPAIAAGAVCLGLAGAALLAPQPSTALALLIVGYAVAALLDRQAAKAGNAPAHFARLRPPQLLLGAAGLAGCWAWLVH